MMFPPSQSATPSVRGFEVLERLGAGGAGHVYLARSKGGRLVAIKTLGQAGTTLDPEQKKGLAREASLCARLAHPAIVQVRAFVDDAAVAALVFEYVEGVALARFLRFLSSTSERLPDRAAFYVIERLASALAHAHSNTDDNGFLVPIVHRDVSPSNVLLGWDGAVKLTDFGMAKMLGTSSGTRAGIVAGTLGCMSPEQARGDSVTERADVYAVALLAWRLLTGLSPFARYRGDEVELLRAMRNPQLPPLASVRRDLPAPVLDIIARALTVDPEQRRVTAEEIRKVIAECIDVAAGRHELRQLLVDSRKRLEAMVTSNGVDQTYTVADPEAGLTLRYEDVALALEPDEDDEEVTAGIWLPPEVPVAPLPPMMVSVPPGLSDVAAAAPTRAPLPSLSELTVLSGIELRSAASVSKIALYPPTRTTPPTRAAPRRAPDVRDTDPPRVAAPRRPPRVVLFIAGALLLIFGATVGATVAWLFMQHG